MWSMIGVAVGSFGLGLGYTFIALDKTSSDRPLWAIAGQVAMLVGVVALRAAWSAK